MTFTFIILVHTKEDAVSNGNMEVNVCFKKGCDSFNGEPDETFHLDDSQSIVTSDSLLVTVLLLETQSLDRSRGEHGPGNLIWLSLRCTTISGTLSHEAGDPDFDFHQPVQSSTPNKQAKPKQPNLGKGKHASIVNCAKIVPIIITIMWALMRHFLLQTTTVSLLLLVPLLMQ